MGKRLLRLGALLLLVLLAGGILTAVAASTTGEQMAATQIDFNRVQMESENFGLHWNVIGGGGSTMSSPSYRVSGTIGQPVIGNFSSTSFTHHAGFWQEWLYRLFLPITVRD